MNGNTGFNWGLPRAASSYAHEIDHLIGLLHWVMVMIFVLWGIFFVYCLIRYRARDGQRGTYHQTGENASLIPDALVLAFELWLIVAFGVPMWRSIKQETPNEKDSTVVQLVAQQFAWNFQYAGPDGKFGRRAASLVSASNSIGLDDSDPDAKDDVTTINNLHVPLGKPVILHMTSKDVIHDFAVAEFRNKHDVVPGLSTTLWFDPLFVGKFEIGCSQLCGLGHTRMRGDVIVETPEDYAAWMKEQLADKAGSADASDVQPVAADKRS